MPKRKKLPKIEQELRDDILDDEIDELVALVDADLDDEPIGEKCDRTIDDFKSEFEDEW